MTAIKIDEHSVSGGMLWVQGTKLHESATGEKETCVTTVEVMGTLAPKSNRCRFRVEVFHQEEGYRSIQLRDSLL
jgi:hypothetical protein